MKALVIFATTAIGTLIGYSISGGLGGGPTLGTMLNGVATMMLMAMGGGIGLALGAVIALVLWTNERDAAAGQDPSDPE